MPNQHRVFLTGATGYLGTRLIPLLLSQGNQVTALTREQSKHKLPTGCEVATGDALNGDSYRQHLTGADTFVHLVGVAHPGPAKARQFVEIDLKSAQEAIRVAYDAGIRHFVYLSVAHPAPVMRAYIEVRSVVERTLRESGLNATALRPWYVLGPGHRWPYVLLPFYRLAEAWPGTRESALRLGLVTLTEMVCSLAAVVADPASGFRVVEVPKIREVAHHPDFTRNPELQPQWHNQ